MKNSINEVLERLHILYNNFTSTFELVKGVIESENNLISREIEDQSGNLRTITFPSFKAILDDQTSLRETINSMLAINQTGRAIILDKSGNPSEIYKTNFKDSADKITYTDSITHFNTKRNHFFEEFANPMLHVTLDLSDKVSDETEKTIVHKYIILNDALWERIGNDIINTSHFIDYIEGIDYIIDENEYFIKTNQKRYFGEFTVLKVETDANSNLLVTLQNLSYNDRFNPEINSRSLSSGDFITLQNGSSKFEVLSVNEPTNQITVRNVGGVAPLPVGINVLTLVDESSVRKEIEIGITINQRLAVFIAAINPRTTVFGDFSDVIKFYTNDLTILTPTGNKNFAEYYFSQVVDFGKFIENLAIEASPPRTLGITPDAPTLDANNFTVVQTNSHLTDQKEYNKVKKLSANKTKMESEIAVFDDTIKTLTESINTQVFRSERERTSVETQLNNAQKNRAQSVLNLNAILTQIKDSSTALNNVTPQYAVIGFWGVDAPKISPVTKPQEIIGYRIQYRKKNANGGNSRSVNIQFEDNNSTRNGAFSDWRDLPIRIRNKVVVNGVIQWEEINVENTDEININQLEIPIVQGEIVEIRMKAQSEAGYPQSPLESPWSQIITVSFPEEFNDNEELQQIIDERNEALATQKTEALLESKGINRHLANQFTNNGKTIVHNAFEIDSGAKTSEQNIITVGDQLINLANRLSALEETVNNRIQGIKVFIEDSEGNEFPISEFETKEINAGYYLSELENVDTNFGTIISKNYFIKIKNENASDIQLFSLNPGDLSNEVNPIQSNIMGKAPIIVINSDNGIESPLGNYQRNGQILYVRDKDVANLYNQWDDSEDLLNKFDAYITNTYNPSYPHADGVSSENERVLVVLNNDTNKLEDKKPSTSQRDFLSISTLHPLYLEYIDASTTITRQEEIIELVKEISNSAVANVQGIQAGINKSTGVNVYPKLSYNQNDRFLIGGKSCGSYAFLNVRNISDIQVSGSANSSNKVIAGKSEIKIPVVFQYRMTDATGAVNGLLDRVDQVLYTKTLGIDLKAALNQTFSFDIKFTARYRNTDLV